MLFVSVIAAAAALAESPGVWAPVQLHTAGTFPRSVQRLHSADTFDLLVFANGSDLAPAPLTGFCLEPDAIQNEKPLAPGVGVAHGAVRLRDGAG